MTNNHHTTSPKRRALWVAAAAAGILTLAGLSSTTTSCADDADAPLTAIINQRLVASLESTIPPLLHIADQANQAAGMQYVRQTAGLLADALGNPTLVPEDEGWVADAARGVALVPFEKELLAELADQLTALLQSDVLRSDNVAHLTDTGEVIYRINAREVCDDDLICEALVSGLGLQVRATLVGYAGVNLELLVAGESQAPLATAVGLGSIDIQLNFNAIHRVATRVCKEMGIRNPYAHHPLAGVALISLGASQDPYESKAHMLLSVQQALHLVVPVGPDGQEAVVFIDEAPDLYGWRGQSKPQREVSLALDMQAATLAMPAALLYSSEGSPSAGTVQLSLEGASFSFKATDHPGVPVAFSRVGLGEGPAELRYQPANTSRDKPGPIIASLELNASEGHQLEIKANPPKTRANADIPSLPHTPGSAAQPNMPVFELAPAAELEAELALNPLLEALGHRPDPAWDASYALTLAPVWEHSWFFPRITPTTGGIRIIAGQLQLDIEYAGGHQQAHTAQAGECLYGPTLNPAQREETNGNASMFTTGPCRQDTP